MALRHGRACPGHPRLKPCGVVKDVDARDKPGHDDLDKTTKRKRSVSPVQPDQLALNPHAVGRQDADFVGCIGWLQRD